MPWAPPTNITNGSVMQWSAVESNLASLRAYLNAVPATDLAAGSITRDHVVRPKILGWPTDGLLSGAQVVVGDRYGMDGGGMSVGHAAWGQRADRITIAPRHLDDDYILTRIGKSVYLHNQWTHDVVIHVTGAAMVRTPLDPAALADGPWYPDGNSTAGCVDGAGWLSVYRVNRSTGVVVEFSAGKAKLYPTNFRTTALEIERDETDRWHVYYRERLTGGAMYDFVLGYRPPATPVEVVQISLADVSLDLEMN